MNSKKSSLILMSLVISAPFALADTVENNVDAARARLRETTQTRNRPVADPRNQGGSENAPARRDTTTLNDRVNGRVNDRVDGRVDGRMDGTADARVDNRGTGDNVDLTQSSAGRSMAVRDENRGSSTLGFLALVLAIGAAAWFGLRTYRQRHPGV